MDLPSADSVRDRVAPAWQAQISTTSVTRCPQIFFAGPEQMVDRGHRAVAGRGSVAAALDEAGALGMRLQAQLIDDLGRA